MHTFQPKQPTLGKNKNLYLLPYSNDREWKASKALKCIFNFFVFAKPSDFALKKKKNTYMATTVLIQRKNCR